MIELSHERKRKIFTERLGGSLSVGWNRKGPAFC